MCIRDRHTCVYLPWFHPPPWPRSTFFSLHCRVMCNYGTVRTDERSCRHPVHPTNFWLFLLWFMPSHCFLLYCHLVPASATYLRRWSGSTPIVLTWATYRAAASFSTWKSFVFWYSLARLMLFVHVSLCRSNLLHYDFCCVRCCDVSQLLVRIPFLMVLY